MSNGKVLEKRRREYLAKPALLRRRNVTQSLLDATQSGNGIVLDIREIVFGDFSLTGEDPEAVRREYWAAEMWSKFPFDLPGVDRKEAAKAAFYDAEVRCRTANERLYDLWSRPHSSELRQTLGRARRKLAGLLSDISTSEVVNRARWGPGASTSLKAHRASHQHKWEFATHATFRALPWIQAFWKHNGLPDREIQIVPGNRVTTVPKNAKTDRVIAIEPDWNMFFQLGVGAAIRRRLQRVGQLLPTGQVTNQRRACEGSVTGDIATIDLKSASDSVSLALCELLLPPSLTRILLSLRSDMGEYDGVTARYEKLSSMGNGATFEVETALFWAIASSVGEGDVTVYGDDITVRTADAPRVIEVLEFLGFQVNSKKTFTAGFFRESCGGHYFKGCDITPPYFRKPVDSLPRYIAAGNSITRRVGWRDWLPNSSLSRRFADSWRLLASEVPRRFRGPRIAGDVCLWTRFDEATPEYDRHLQCFVGQGVKTIRQKSLAPEWGALQAALYGDTFVEEYPTERELGCVCYWYADKWQDCTPSF